MCIGCNMLGGVQCPLGFIQQDVGCDGPEHKVDYPSIGSAETACDVAALFLEHAMVVDDVEPTDLLMRRDELFGEETSHTKVRQAPPCMLLRCFT